MRFEGRQPVCFVLDVDELFGRSPVFAPKATLLVRFIVLAVKDAVRSPEAPVSVQHGRRSSDCEIADRRSFRLPSSRGIRAELGGFLPRLSGPGGRADGSAAVYDAVYCGDAESGLFSDLF